MKYLYVLVGSKKAFYCEQTLVSMASLKRVAPTAFITLLVDELTDNNFSPEIGRLRNYVNEYVVVPVDENIPPMAKSRYIKTSMRKYVKGDFLYVDADTVWNAPIDENDFVNDIMGVLDGHCLLDTHPLKERIEDDFKRTNCNPNVVEYVNGGVLFSRDTDVSKSFFDLWHEKWKKTSAGGCFVDMPSLNYAIKLMGDKFSLLPDVYNVQISRSWRFFRQSKVIHFFTGWQDDFFESPYLFQKKFFWRSIQKNGLDENAMVAVTRPLDAFEDFFGIYGLAEMKFRQTALYGFIADLYCKRNRKKTFYLLEGLMKKIAQIWR